jgi:tetratricopeptide (TPR) repeat protein
MWHVKLVLAAGLAVALSLGAGASRAQGVDFPNRRNSFTAGELALLPPYCKNIQGFPGYDGPEGDRWRAILGEDFQHFHHYCRGLRDVHFARTAVVTAQQRKFLWERSLNEYEYMIRNSKPTMVLMPEIYLRMGESFVELRRLGEAQLAFEASRKLKPDYWPAYTAWIDQLLLLKQFGAARELAEEGLKQLPDSPELRSRLERAKTGGGAR